MEEKSEYNLAIVPYIPPHSYFLKSEKREEYILPIPRLISGKVDYGEPVKWVEEGMQNLVKSVSVRIGNEEDECFQSITLEPCKLCKKMVITEDIANGYPTVLMENICSSCIFENCQIPNFFILPPLLLDTESGS